MLRYIIKLLLIICGIVASYFAFMTFTDYRPEEVIDIDTTPLNSTTEPPDTLKITTFNIGYATLDESADFFMEGGKQTRAGSEEQVTNNLEAITNFIKEENSDIILFQEVDIKAMRSRNVNQYEYFQNNLEDYHTTYAINYKVPWVPVPVLKPYGYVKSGITTFSKLEGTSKRYQFPGEEPWPRQLALLDRCFIESKLRYKDTDIYVINVHMSAYDAGGTIREQQVQYLKEYLEEKRKENAYVIIGGDFNHELPGTDSDDFNTDPKPDWLKQMTEVFEGYTWHVQTDQPTSRSMEQPYIKGENYECIIDGFMVSDNIEFVNIHTSNLEYKNSDHNPVTIEIKLEN